MESITKTPITAEQLKDLLPNAYNTSVLVDPEPDCEEVASIAFFFARPVDSECYVNIPGHENQNLYCVINGDDENLTQEWLGDGWCECYGVDGLVETDESSNLV